MVISMSVTASKPSKVFPKAAVEARLRKELLVYVGSLASLKGIALPSTPAAQCTFAIQIDSLEVVNILCSVEPDVGFQLKDSVVRTGGYKSIDQALAHVLPRIEKAWQKHWK